MNLDLVGKLNCQIANLKLQLATYRQMAESAKTSNLLSQGVKGTSQMSSTEKWAVLILSAEERLEKLLQEREQAKIELSDKLSSDTDIPPVVKTIFLLRYVDCLLWRVIAKKMCYSLRNIFRYHRIWRGKLLQK